MLKAESRETAKAKGGVVIMENGFEPAVSSVLSTNQGLMKRSSTRLRFLRR